MPTICVNSIYHIRHIMNDKYKWMQVYTIYDIMMNFLLCRILHIRNEHREPLHQLPVPRVHQRPFSALGGPSQDNGQGGGRELGGGATQRGDGGRGDL